MFALELDISGHSWSRTPQFEVLGVDSREKWQSPWHDVLRQLGNRFYVYRSYIVPSHVTICLVGDNAAFASVSPHSDWCPGNQVQRRQ